MGVTSTVLEELNLVDATIQEPLGGAHRDMRQIVASVKAHILDQLKDLSSLATEDLLDRRYTRLMSYGGQ